MTLEKDGIDPEVVEVTIGSLLKYRDDVARVRGEEIARILGRAKLNLAAGAE